MPKLSRKKSFIPTKLFLVLFILYSFIVFSFPTKFQSFFPLNLKLKAQAANVVTFQPTPVPLSDPEIINPMRGYYKWRSEELISNVAPSYDAYERYSWRQIETSKDVYDFDVIENDIQKAFLEGRKFAFRLRDLTSDSISIPEYMKSYGWWHEGQFIPDWNNSYYQERAKAFVMAVGQRYNNDPHIAYIDIGMYGRWGEWHVWNIDYGKAPAGITKATTETLKKIVDWHVEAFSDTRLVMLSGGKDTAEVIVYAMQHPTVKIPIGVRNDCLGTLDGEEHFRDMINDPQWIYLKDRWKTAPFVTEYCNTKTGDGGSAVAINQVKDFHVSMLSNGNFVSNWGDFTNQEKENLILAGKLSGYRFQLNSLSLDSQIAPGSSFNTSSSWSNVGVAPAHEKWNVVIQLRNQTTGGDIAWQGISSLDLEKFLPTKDQKTGIDTPVTVPDTFTLPSSFLPGNYDLMMAVIDPAEYRKPLALAIRGRNATDGSYKLGTTSIVPDVSTPSPSPSSCPADVNQDDTVNVTDIITVLQAWGECPGCIEDLDANDTVNVADIISVLQAWGKCG